MNDMLRRQTGTRKTLEAWRGRTLDPSKGVSCGHMVHEHLVNMERDPPPLPEYSTLTGAVRALRENGWDDVAAWLDSMVERRPSPAFMRLGDIAVAPGEDNLDAVFICAGPFKLFGWHEEYDQLVLVDVDLDTLIGVWEA